MGMSLCFDVTDIQTPYLEFNLDVSNKASNWFALGLQGFEAL